MTLEPTTKPTQTCILFHPTPLKHPKPRPRKRPFWETTSSQNKTVLTFTPAAPLQLIINYARNLTGVHLLHFTVYLIVWLRDWKQNKLVQVLRGLTGGFPVLVTGFTSVGFHKTPKWDLPRQNKKPGWRPALQKFALRGCDDFHREEFFWKEDAFVNASCNTAGLT